MPLSTAPTPSGPLLSRRNMLQVGVALGGGLIVGFVAPGLAAPPAVPGFAPTPSFASTPPARSPW